MSPGPAKQFDREKVLGRALDCFWSNGYEATGMAELLDEMGIGRQSLYDTFGDKRSLFIEALKTYSHIQSQNVIGRLQGPGTAMENLESLLKHMREFGLGNSAKGCFLVNASAEFGIQDEEVTEVIQACKTRIEDALVRTLDQARKEGDLAPGVPSRRLARLIMSVTQGLVLHIKVKKDPAYIDSVLGALMSLLSGK